jgi:hypothetical protein
MIIRRCYKMTIHPLRGRGHGVIAGRRDRDGETFHVRRCLWQNDVEPLSDIRLRNTQSPIVALWITQIPNLQPTASQLRELRIGRIGYRFMQSRQRE